MKADRGPSNEQIIPASYQNMAKRIHIPGLPTHMLPSSPEMNDRSVPVSGEISPISGIGTPRVGTPGPGHGSTSLNAAIAAGSSASGSSTPSRGAGDTLTIGRKVNVNPSS